MEKLNILDKLKKLFGEYEMSWKRLIIFSIACGIYTAAVLLIPGIKETALKEIGVGYECWFILAIFVISNCKSARDAAIKCFVFFLISQPLVYLIQTPFVHRNLIADYYWPWFIKTILTLPGAVIAYQIKRNDLIGTLALSFAGVAIAFSGVAFIYTNISPFKISYMIYGVFLIAATVILGLLFTYNKKYFIIFIAIVLAASIVLGFIYFRFNEPKVYTIELSDENWYLAGCSFKNMDAEIDNDILTIQYYRNSATGKITMMNDKDEERVYSVTIVQGQIVLTEL